LSKRPPQKKKRSRALIVWKRWGDWRKLSIAAFTGLFIAVLLTVQLLPDKVSVMVGDIAPADVIAPRYVQYRDEEKTRLLRQRIASQVPPVYSAIANADATAERGVAGFFDTLEHLQRDRREDPLERRLELLEREAPGLPKDVAKSALTLSPEQIAAARKAAEELIAAAMDEPILADTLEDARKAARERANSLDSALPRRLIGEVVSRHVDANRVYNVEETEAARKRERDSVPPQWSCARASGSRPPT
jgi:membrane-associated HD superfamily phosphohydrolase